MTGIEATEEMTLEQLNAMSGGELLRNEVIQTKNPFFYCSHAEFERIVFLSLRLDILVKFATQRNRHYV